MGGKHLLKDRASVYVLTLVLLLGLAAGAVPLVAAQAAPPRQAGSLCSLLPSGGTITYDTPTDCSASYANDTIRMHVGVVADPKAARDNALAVLFCPAGSPPLSLGEVGNQCDYSDTSANPPVHQVWRNSARGCYYVNSITDVSVDSQGLALHQQVDEKLKAVPSCPGGPTPTTDPAATGAFGMRLACTYNDPKWPGTAYCLAGASNVPEGAEIAYQWYLDGVKQSETGKEFTRADANLSAGSHSVRVVAVDTKTNKALDETVWDFTKPGAAAPVPVQIKTPSGEQSLAPNQPLPVTLQPGQEAQVTKTDASGKKKPVATLRAKPSQKTGKTGKDTDVGEQVMIFIDNFTSWSTLPALSLRSAYQANLLSALQPQQEQDKVLIRVELQQGNLEVELVDPYDSMRVVTSRAVVDATGKNTFLVRHDPQAQGDQVLAYWGRVTVQPAGGGEAVALSTGDRLEVTAGGVGERSRIPFSENAVLQGALEVVGGIVLGTLVLGALAVLAWRGLHGKRARPVPVQAARPSPMPGAPAAPMWTCARCGQANGPAAHFCIRCGSSSPSAPAAWVCARCGQANGPAAHFCIRCGAPRPA